MKQIILTTLTALSLSISSLSFAKVSQDEVSYLFGTQSSIEISMISATEMQKTEGQLFGITFELIGSYVDKAVTIIKPIIGPAVPHLSAAFVAVKDAALKAIAARLTSVLSSF